ncbi:unnamed protein product [Didymodactylos carnosus]|uniref:Uncharacterized protein n=1 Tax=Didymodactylos carnosus TaxID=1234261 RepID=A0A814JM23_9BILA|nr:unnamed protein product [Didymodactylos carnosus]CAF1041086.1 unnamed protein product [Didymodactylos carnosus]CAF3768759.1 unnamed protein product [Didymodactylos carnosus]CAF3811297.1 unnamed protein product [Didymodactylos carnosus]
MLCPNSNNCQQLQDEEHLNSFTHLGIKDIRLLCNHSDTECKQTRDLKHLARYRHNIKQDYLGVAKFFDLNKNINFAQNYQNILQTMKTPKIFESILLHGHVMGRSYMEKLKLPEFVTHTSIQHSRIRKVLDQESIPAIQKQVKEYIKAIVEIEFQKENIRTTDDKQEPRYDRNQQENLLLIPKMEHALTSFFSNNDIAAIKRKTLEIVKDSIKLHQSPTGIGYEADEALETNKHVFSILGPHTGWYYGDIVIVFKPELLLHPDFNFTMQAGTGFVSRNVYKLRPWLSDPGTDAGHINHFHSTKMHCALDDYEYVTGLELMALAGRDKKTMNVDLNDIIQYYKSCDSHQVIEGHLPQLIPLSYVEQVFMPKNVFDSLNKDAQNSQNHVFKNRVMITNDIVDLNAPNQFGPPDTTRTNYHDYIFQQLLKKTNIRARNVPNDNSNTNPKATANNKKLSNDTVYIYFKIKDGDFMLILTNERINSEQVQSNLKYLTCYVSPMPSTNVSGSDEYYETNSYINNMPPLTHEGVLQKKSFLATSNHFHKGCNTDDYIQYCLTIQYHTGRVSLAHAGVNGIYSHSPLEHKFSRQNLDLRILQYIQIQSFSQTISIQNVFIKFEQLQHLHLTMDKQFKMEVNPDEDESDSEQPYGKNKKNQSKAIKELTKPVVKLVAAPAGINLQRMDGSKQKPGFFHRIWKRLFGSKADQQQYAQPHEQYTHPLQQQYQPHRQQQQHQQGQQRKPDSSDEQKPEQEKQSQNPVCRHSIHCLVQYSRNEAEEHNNKYTHPCRFSEICRERADRKHSLQFTHDEHKVPTCRHDQQCTQKHDPLHRYEFRHTGLPDLLRPCKYQTKCRQKSSEEHTISFFHGENIPLTTGHTSGSRNND